VWDRRVFLKLADWRLKPRIGDPMFMPLLFPPEPESALQPPMDLDPREFPYEHRTRIPDDHVRFAYSIVTAYAVLEQLGLALQGQAFHDGKWISAKKVELEKRLQKAGIDLNKLEVWLLRAERLESNGRATPKL